MAARPPHQTLKPPAPVGETWPPRPIKQTAILAPTTCGHARGHWAARNGDTESWGKRKRGVASRQPQWKRSRITINANRLAPQAERDAIEL
eukprot:Skav214590  [mRNA]  locus=scaffold57:439915:440187:- [translate_table: standard]